MNFVQYFKGWVQYEEGNKRECDDKAVGSRRPAQIPQHVGALLPFRLCNCVRIS